jgi:hypothetical protein
LISEPNRQQSFWYNDTKGDASIWVTRFNGLHPSEDMMVTEDGLVEIRVGETYCVSGYCSPNVSLGIFDDYVERPGISIRAATKSVDQLIVAGDFNAKSKAWGGTKTDTRGRMLSEVLGRMNLGCLVSTNQRGTRRSFLDVTSVNDKLREKHKLSVVIDVYNASDHKYVLHKFKSVRRPSTSGVFKFITKDMVPEIFINNFDDMKRKFLNQVDALQRILKESRELSLKKAFLPRGSRNPNYWWNDEIARLQGETLKKRRRTQTASRRNEDSAERKGADYKATKRALRSAIFSSKRLAWKEFTATLDRDPWGLPFRTVIARLKTAKPHISLAREEAVNVIGTLFLTDETGTPSNWDSDDNGGDPSPSELGTRSKLKILYER